MDLTNSAMLAAALAVLRIPAELWAATVVAYQIPTELPSTVIGLIGLFVISETGLITYLLRERQSDRKDSMAALVRLADKFVEQVEKQAAVTATITNALENIRVAIQQGRKEDELEKRLDDILAKLDEESGASISKPAPRRATKGG